MRTEQDARALVKAGFEHEVSCLWSRDGVFYGEEAALQKAWDEGVWASENQVCQKPCFREH